MKKLLLLFFISSSLISCKQDNGVEDQISKIDIEMGIERFDSLFAHAKPSDFSKLKAQYPFMFSEQYKDSFWLAKMRDTLQQDLSKQVALHITDFGTIESEVRQMFQHLKYYFPGFTVPRVISAISYVDYRNKAIVTDTIALISIDTYLGAEHEYYQGIQKYIRQGFTEDQIVVDMANEYADKYILRDNKTLLDEMIYSGKKLYFKDKIIPFKTDAEKIGYTQEQLDWAKANEVQIWQYFVDRELLYSTDSKLPGRFINAAPFSKFNLELIDNESPGRIGQYIGWNIVRSYMEHNDVSFQELLNKDTEEIFNNSYYKPQK